MNYIRHLNAVLEKFWEDQSVKSNHISLYMALFGQWNLNRFVIPMFISRSELMLASKIGSCNTYHKVLKELSSLGYIKYIPSHNPMVGSKVYMYIFDATAKQVASQPRCNIDTTEPTTSIINKQYKTSKQREPPTQQEVIDFFNSKNSNELEASKFFYHYQSIGWLMGGRAPMKDWRAAATKWILNTKNFTVQSKELDPVANTNKNYSEPL